MRALGSIILALSLGSLAGAAEPPPLLFAELGDLTLESDCGHLVTGCELDQFKEIVGSFLQ